MYYRLKHWLKKYFIPHEHNDHKPHILRIEATVVVLSAILLLEAVFLVQLFFVYPKSGFFAEILPSILVDLTNKERSEGHLAYLTSNPILEKTAQMKADDMAKNGYFSHNSPTGITPWYWFDQAGYNFSYAGENLAINFFDSSDVTKAWMNSPTHRANILNGNFTEIGIAAAKGIYQGKETIFVVQVFGKPSKPASQPAIKTTNIIGKDSPVEKIVEKIITPANISSTEDVLNKTIVAVKGENLAETLNSGSSTGIPDGVPEIDAAPFAGSTVSFFKKAISMPHLLTNYLYLMLFTMILLALFLKIFIKIKVQHPALIINGASLLLVIAAIIMINQNLTSSLSHVLPF